MPLPTSLRSFAPMHFLFSFFVSRLGSCDGIALGRSWALTQFFWGFNHADAIGRGHDPTVTPFKFTKDLTKKFLFDQLQLTLAIWRWKISIFFKCCCHGGTDPTGTYRILSSLTSRATRTFKAWCLTTRRPVFLKDTWRILSTSLRPEHEIYEKRTAAKVQYMIYRDCAQS